MNGTAAMEQKLAGMTIQDDNAPSHRQESNGSSTPPEVANRANSLPGAKHLNHMINGPRAIKSVVAAKQRVPNADEFPVLGGSTTPPSRSPASNGHVNGHVGPTAAQVLQAPPPMRRDSSKASTSRSQTPDQGRESQSAQGPKSVSEITPVVPTAPQDPVVNKLPVSFAAVANGAPDASKEVSVSA